MLSHSWGAVAQGGVPQPVPPARGAKPTWRGHQLGQHPLLAFDKATLLFVAACGNNVWAIFKSCFI